MSDVAAPLVASLLAYAVEQSLDRAALLHASGVPQARLDDPDGRIATSQYAALMAAAVAASGRATFGLEFGIAARPERWGVLGYSTACCRNLGEAVRVQHRYQLLVGGLGELHSTLYPDHLQLEWRTAAPPPRALADEEIAGWVAFARFVTGSMQAPRSVHFRYPAPAEVQPYLDFFACPVHFDAPWSGLTMQLSQLALPLLSADDQRLHGWCKQAETTLSRLGAPGSLLAALAAHLDQMLPEGEPSLDLAAQALGTSSRTLQRRLAEAGRSFSSFVDALRQERALAWVAQKQRSLTEIAFLLGFSEQSAFHRAFKRWTGMAPSQYRKQCQDGV